MHRSDEEKYISVKAALARATALTMASSLQDTLSRLGLLGLCVMQVGGGRQLAVVLVLGTLSLAWMLSKYHLREILNRIEEDFVIAVSRSEVASNVAQRSTLEQPYGLPAPGPQDPGVAAKWELLRIVLDTYATSTARNVAVRTIVFYEPLILGIIACAISVLL